ncbi:MAG: hypothetical protein GYA43_13550 [Bacteroidales bacterium]|nr:hypothetical protein [Bacteroidales bacterium]
MNKIINIRAGIVALFFFIVTVTPCLAQVSGAVGDTSKIKQEQVAAGKQEQNMNQIQNRVQNQKQAANQSGNAEQQGAQGGNGQGVKQIKSARPDMTKANSARPPQITRPSGSSMPKGMGRPGGAMRRGGR